MMLTKLLLIAALTGQGVAFDVTARALRLAYPTLLGPTRCSECVRTGMTSTVQLFPDYSSFTCSKGHSGGTMYRHRCNSPTCAYQQLTQ